MLREIDYDMSVPSWDGTSVRIADSDGNEFLSIPYDFITSAATHSVSKITYLLLTVQIALEDDQHHLQLCRDSKPCQANDQVLAGIYILITPPANELRFRRGPQGKSLFKTLSAVPSKSTVSRSSRSSQRQSNFRLAVFGRDSGGCLISGKRNLSEIEACHIIPYSLGQDFLDTLTDYKNSGKRVGLYSVTNGLTLSKNLHSVFDRYEFGIWVENGKYYIHSFLATQREYHGMQLQWFEKVPITHLPSAELLRWHYQQCVMARFRGFQVSMIPRDIQPF